MPEPDVRRIALPPGLVPVDGSDLPEATAAIVDAKIKKDFGPQWKLSYVEANVAVAVPTLAVSEMTSDGWDRIVTQPSTKSSEGKALDAFFSDIINHGDPKPPKGTSYRMVAFDPERGTLRFSPLTKKEEAARDAIATDVFRTDPWNVTISAAKDGGFTVGLPRTYSPSRHDALLDRVAQEKIGLPGWYVVADAKTFTARVVPGELPTFLPSYPPPSQLFLGRSSVQEQMMIDVGVKLGGHGVPNQSLFLDFNTSPHVLVTGQTRGGKTAWVNNLFFQVKQHGWDAVVANTKEKENDVQWMKPFVRDEGFGVTSKDAAMAALALVQEQVEVRTREFNRLGVAKWQELTTSDREAFPLILTFVDEVPQLLRPMMTKATAKEMDEEDPRRIEAMADFVTTAFIEYYLGKLIKVAAAYGVCVVLSSQGATATEGVPPGLRGNLGNRILCGANPAVEVFKYAFRNPRSVPEVPAWIRNNPDPFVPKGAGVAEFDGQEPCVYKGYFEESSVLGPKLRALGVRTNTLPEPTLAHIERFAAAPSSSDGPASDVDWGQTKSPVSGRALSEISHAMGDDWDVGDDGGRVTGFEKANLARHLVAQG